MYQFKFNHKDFLLSIHYATQKDIDMFTFPKGIRCLTISGDQIDHLIIPDGVEFLTIGRMGLKTIYLPDSVKYFNCAENLLKTIELPQNISMVDIDDNYLETLTFRNGNPTALEIFRLKENSRIHTLDFAPPDTLYEVQIVKCGSLKNVHPELQKIINKNEDYNIFTIDESP